MPSPAVALQRGGPETAYSLDERPVGGSSSAAAAGSHPNNYDERPAQGKGNYTADDDGALGEEPSDFGGAGAAAECDIPPPAGWPADLPPPEHLSSANAKDAEPLTELAGGQCTAAGTHPSALLQACTQVLLHCCSEQLMHFPFLSPPGEVRRHHGRQACMAPTGQPGTLLECSLVACWSAAW
jgi:hypothetical protein